MMRASSRIAIATTLALALAHAGCGGGSPPSPAPVGNRTTGTTEVRLPIVPAVVGERVDVIDTMSMTMTITTQGQTVAMVHGSAERSSSEVLAVDGIVASKIRVRYDTLSETEGPVGQARPLPSPAQGHTYVVERRGGELLVSRDDGVASAEEIDAVRAEHRTFGTPDVMEQIVASKVFRVGERIDFSIDDLRRLAEDAARSGSPPPRAGALTLREVDGDLASFELSMEMAMVDGSLTMEMALRGTVRISITDGRARELILEGPVKGSGSATVEGTLQGSKIYIYP